MDAIKKTVNQYIRPAKRKLVCSRKSKTAFYRDLNAGVREYLQARPEATMEELKGFLGEPQQLINDFVEQLSPKEILKARRRIKWIIALIILAVTAVIGIGLYLYFQQFSHMTFVVYPPVVHAS